MRLCNQVKHNLKDRRERKKENKTHKAATSALISDSTDEFKASLGQRRRRAGKEQLIVTALRASIMATCKLWLALVGVKFGRQSNTATCTAIGVSCQKALYIQLSGI
jgi:hypothetical protein